MNRKIKKQVKIAVILLFFLVAGGWYVLFYSDNGKKQESEMELTGIASAMCTEAPENTDKEPSSKDHKEAEELVVYVCGAVNEPGICVLAPGSRLYEAVTMAGGFSAEAVPAYHNLARDIMDGERIYILSTEEIKALSVEQQVAGENGEANSSETGTGQINLNTATTEQLMELPGIGEAKAAAIISYRTKAGAFADIEEIMNVNGIGEAMFEKIKDKITVK